MKYDKIAEIEAVNRSGLQLELDTVLLFTF